MESIPQEGLIFKYNDETPFESYLGKFDDYIENHERIINPNIDTMKAPLKMKVSAPEYSKKQHMRDATTGEILTLSDASGKSTFIGEKAVNDSKYGTFSTI